jgi:hypothetical protein
MEKVGSEGMYAPKSRIENLPSLPTFLRRKTDELAICATREY